MEKKYFLDLKDNDIEQLVLLNNEKKFCVEQINSWIYKKKQKDFLKFSNVSKSFRDILNKGYTLTGLNLVSKEISKKDGTIRFNFRTKDNYLVATVFLPKSGRNVVCVSTQIGCNIGCNICNSGKKKFVRNLSQGEILEQVINIEIFTNKRVDGILLMGMGEPLLNYDNVVEVVKIFTDKEKFGIGKRHITISTVGIVPKIYDLAEESLGIRLAISLHSPNDILRKKIVSNKIKYSVEEILKSGIYYMVKNGTDLTIEYVLIQGINDSTDLAKELIQFFNRVKVDKSRIKINLIPNNEVDGTGFNKPSKKIVLEFQKVLEENGYLTFIRETRGDDIKASCGQLGF